MTEPRQPASFEELLGKGLLVGVTYLDASGALIEHIQRYGRVTAASRKTGIVIACDDGSEFTIPPALDAVYVAEAGLYTLKASGQQIAGPDYLATFDVTQPG